VGLVFKIVGGVLGFAVEIRFVKRVQVWRSISGSWCECLGSGVAFISWGREGVYHGRLRLPTVL